ncbi:hypothetical protein SDC9_120524 [bioreactor metagenome]|uniref:Uncharacterized protein n=1 Tax=bioreactor metagenome TaxID=1076179 RepID=A0A645C772_9ZZZZ
MRAAATSGTSRDVGRGLPGTGRLRDPRRGACRCACRAAHARRWSRSRTTLQECRCSWCSAGLLRRRGFPRWSRGSRLRCRRCRRSRPPGPGFPWCADAARPNLCAGRTGSARPSCAGARCTSRGVRRSCRAGAICHSRGRSWCARWLPARSGAAFFRACHRAW